MTTFCYLVRTHQNPAQIERLVRAILEASPGGWILLLHDCKGCSLEGASWLRDERVVLRFTSQPVVRGEFPATATYLEGLGMAIESGRDADWFINLSGQDYPLRPLREIESELAAAPWDAFIDYWETGGPEDRWAPQQARIRYHYQYRRLPKWTKPLLQMLKWTHALQSRFRIFTTYGAHLGTLSRRLPFGPELRLMGGSEWHYLRRACVVYLLEYCRLHPELVDHYRRTAVPEESLVPTVLGNAQQFRICRDNRRYVDWRGALHGRPRIITTDHLSEITTGRFDFARKFDAAVDAQVLDRLDAHICAHQRPAHQ